MLFRQEAIDARRDAWLGRTQLAQPLSVRLTAPISLALLLSAAAYLVLGSYTRRVHAAGAMLPAAGLTTVASPVAGVIVHADITEDQTVRAGQVLFTVNVDAVSAAGSTGEAVLAGLRAQKDLIGKQRMLRLSTADIEKQALRNQLGNLAVQRVQIAGQVTTDDATLPAVRASLNRLQRAARDHLVTDTAVQGQMYSYAQLQNSHTQFLQALTSVEGKIADLASQLSHFGNNLAHDVNELDRQGAQLDQQIAEGEARHAVEITAPSDGTLAAIRGHAGQPVTAGTTLATVLPRGASLQANLVVTSAALGFIREGAPVLLRYAAYPYQRFGLYRGTVTEVTRAPVSVGGQGVGQPDERATSDAAAAPTALYRVTVAPRQPYVLAYGERKPLQAGMEVEADIMLDRRPLYQWAFDPLYRLQRGVSVVTGQEVGVETGEDRP